MLYIRAGTRKYRLNKKYITYQKKLPEDAVCVFYTTLKDVEDSSNGTDTITIDNVNYRLCEKPNKCKVIGFLATNDENTYVAIISKRNFLPIGFIAFFNSSLFIPLLSSVLVIGASVIGGLVYYDNFVNHGKVNIGVPSTEREPTSNDPVVPYDSETEETDIMNQKYTIIDGITYEGEYMDVYLSDTIPLGNNEENEGIYLQFVIKDESGNEIYVSPKLNPGEKIDWSPCKYLENGLQKVTVSVNVYHQDTNMQDIGTDMDVTFNINK